jgi:GTPase SAR1 family protein
MSKPVNVVVVGPSEAGKTLLLRHLKRLATNRKDDNDYVSSSIDPISCKTVPTTGCENCKFQWAGQAVVMREVGSCLQLRWNKWTRRQHSGTSRSPAAASKVIFVVDASDMVHRAASSLTALMDVLDEYFNAGEEEEEGRAGVAEGSGEEENQGINRNDISQNNNDDGSRVLVLLNKCDAVVESRSDNSGESKDGSLRFTMELRRVWQLLQLDILMEQYNDGYEVEGSLEVPEDLEKVDHKRDKDNQESSGIKEDSAKKQDSETINGSSSSISSLLKDRAMDMGSDRRRYRRLEVAQVSALSGLNLEESVLNWIVA